MLPEHSLEAADYYLELVAPSLVVVHRIEVDLAAFASAAVEPVVAAAAAVEEAFAGVHLNSFQPFVV